MDVRVGSALLLAMLQAMLLAGCAELPLFSGSPGWSDYASAPPAPAAIVRTADPSFRVSELRTGMTKAQLEAMYPGRLAFDSRDAGNALYFVEPLGVSPNTLVARHRLVLWLNDGKLATFDVVQSTEPVAAATIPAPASPAATGSIRASRQASATATQPQGKYGVQIAAVRSEADARALIDSMRARYPDQLAQQWATINRVSLPQGVFYRVVIGPIGSEQQASQLCNSLKAQGAECLIRGV